MTDEELTAIRERHAVVAAYYAEAGPPFVLPRWGEAWLGSRLCEAQKDRAALVAEVERLRTAIEKHREHTGHGLCWENDVELWAALGDGKAEYPHATVPPHAEFLARCSDYWVSRFSGRDDEPMDDGPQEAPPEASGEGGEG